MIVYPYHIHAAGLCITGARPWLRRYGWTIADLRHGRITTQMLRDTGDALGIRVAVAAESDHGRK